MVNFGEIMNEQERRQAAGTAFDDCPTKKIDIDPTKLGEKHGLEGPKMMLTCAKYPTGTRFLDEKRAQHFGERSLVAQRLGCVSCEFSKGDPEKAVLEAQVAGLHEKLRDIPGKLYVQGHHIEAVQQSFIMTKETLRDISGYESATDAIGLGGLHFVGRRGEHVDGMYQNAAKFTLMSVDNMRNVEMHSIPHDEDRTAEYAYPRMMVCSLALGFLDNTEIRK
jgi:hypothetical protein